MYLSDFWEIILYSIYVKYRYKFIVMLHVVLFNSFVHF